MAVLATFIFLIFSAVLNEYFMKPPKEKVDGSCLFLTNGWELATCNEEGKGGTVHPP
ncbi:hypothetical protein L9F63_006370, partial [Diploptera punctata]